MSAPKVFIAYAPRGAGLRSALAYVSAGRDVYGWFTGPRADASYAKAELATGEVNWTYYSPHFERGVLRHLARRWPLEYRFDQDLSSALSP